METRQEIRRANLKSLLEGNIERYHHPDFFERIGWGALVLLLAFGFGLLLVLFTSGCSRVEGRVERGGGVRRGAIKRACPCDSGKVVKRWKIG